jgi:hypothetical protein
MRKYLVPVLKAVAGKCHFGQHQNIDGAVLQAPSDEALRLHLIGSHLRQLRIELQAGDAQTGPPFADFFVRLGKIGAADLPLADSRPSFVRPRLWGEEEDLGAVRQ